MDEYKKPYLALFTVFSERNAMVLLLAIICMLLSSCSDETYKQLEFVSSIEKEDCYLCGDRSDHEISDYWGQDNVGLLCLNSFELLPVEINRYDDGGRLIEEATGVVQMQWKSVGEARVWLVSNVDRGYADADITPGGGVDAEAMGTYFCQACLDDFSDSIWGGHEISEIAVINFATREARLLTSSCTGFTFDNYLLDCHFGDDGKINLNITYRPIRYQRATDAVPCNT